jgi:hypothetical protein
MELLRITEIDADFDKDVPWDGDLYEITGLLRLVNIDKRTIIVGLSGTEITVHAQTSELMIKIMEEWSRNRARPVTLCCHGRLRNLEYGRLIGLVWVLRVGAASDFLAGLREKMNGTAGHQ